MKKVIISMVLFVSLVIFLAFSDPVFAEEKPVGKIIGIIGTVDYRVATGSESVADAGAGAVKTVAFTPWEKAKPHQLVYAKDAFRTSRKSRLKILFNDKSLIALGPKSEMKIQSYIYKPEEKLRQGVINIAQGLSMYVINKSQTNSASSFRIVTPTANIAARGTQGYTSVSPSQTFVANESGAVAASNVDLNVIGEQLVGAMMSTLIALGQAPTDPVPLTEAQLAQIRNVIIAWVGSRYPGLVLDGSGGGSTEDGGDFDEIFDLFDDQFSESCTLFD